MSALEIPPALHCLLLLTRLYTTHLEVYRRNVGGPWRLRFTIADRCHCSVKQTNELGKEG